MIEDLDKEILTYLVCPLTGGQLVWNAEHQELICKASGLAYPVRDGIPVLRYDHARELMQSEDI
jgi:hypothetical protein